MLDDRADGRIVDRQYTDAASVSERLLDRRDDPLILVIPLKLREHLKQDEKAQQQRHHVTESHDPLRDALDRLFSTLARHVRPPAPQARAAPPAE